MSQPTVPLATNRSALGCWDKLHPILTAGHHFGPNPYRQFYVWPEPILKWGYAAFILSLLDIACLKFNWGTSAEENGIAYVSE